MLLVLLAAGCSAATPVAPPEHRTSWFVAPSGNDEATGVDAPSAVRTIGRALELLSPGDTLYILPGIYSETIHLTDFGSPELTTTIMGINGLPTIDGSGDSESAIACTRCVNIEISCLDIRGHAGPAVALADSDGITLRDLVISDIGTDGVVVRDSHRVVIEWLEITRIGTAGSGAAIVLEDVVAARVADNRASDAGLQPFSFTRSEVDAARNLIVG